MIAPLALLGLDILKVAGVLYIPEYNDVDWQKVRLLMYV